MTVYLDNAATTPLDQEVFEAMKPFMLEDFGNPSSQHGHGRKVRAAIESARKTVASLLNASTHEIFFTSGGTEADNTLIQCGIESNGIKHAITSRLEHHAVLHTMQYLESRGKIELTYVDIDRQGFISLSHLEELLKKNPKSMVSLMHANNEIGNILDLQAVAYLCNEYGSFLHSDTVQTMGHYSHDFGKLNMQCAVGAAHKFHGPKGAGFMYINNNAKIASFIHGGSQERDMRGGTENVYGIIGTAKALEIAYRDMDEHQSYIQKLKDRMIDKLKANVPDVAFNGASAIADKSLYTVLNVCLPKSESNDMLLFTLDINGISASGGSACSSGTGKGSHVLEALEVEDDRASVRFSFSKYNKPEEIDYVVEKLADFYKVEA
ncbi:MAG: cysteine desulfurase family protein [Bacteroidota bacterium]